jgi:hypothetical protein
MNEVRSYHLLWRCVPFGVEVCTFKDSLITRSSSCCWCCCARRTNFEGADMSAGYQPFCNAARLLRDTAASFVLALLFHFSESLPHQAQLRLRIYLNRHVCSQSPRSYGVPSVPLGAERSLGSPHNHQIMGAVWFGGWPVWFVILGLLRSPMVYISVPLSCHSTHTRTHKRSWSGTPPQQWVRRRQHVLHLWTHGWWSACLFG